jgi:hypothetical protein
MSRSVWSVIKHWKRCPSRCAVRADRGLPLQFSVAIKGLAHRLGQRVAERETSRKHALGQLLEREVE